MKKEIILMIVIVNCCFALNSYAMRLGEINYNEDEGMRVIASSLGFSWAIGLNDEHPMYWEAVTPFDVGKTFRQSPATSDNFVFFDSMLTNGTGDLFWILSYYSRPGIGGGTGLFESQWLNKFVPTQSVDFCGYKITDIDLTINALTIDSPGRNPNGDGVWTNATFNTTFTIYGVPEPATLLLLSLGAVILRKRR